MYTIRPITYTSCDRSSKHTVLRRSPCRRRGYYKAIFRTTIYIDSGPCRYCKEEARTKERIVIMMQSEQKRAEIREKLREMHAHLEKMEEVSKEVKRELKKKEKKRVERKRRAGVKEQEKEARRGSEEKRGAEKEG
jgi:glutaredoxin